MTDERIVEYLRSRGRAEPPHDLVRSVMVAVDAAPPVRSSFSAYLPAVVAAGAVAVVAALALLLGPGRDIGPAPTPSGSPSASATSATLPELEAAVAAATERLAAAPGVQGIHSHTVEGYLASATWFDWRPSGDEVVITRTDIDVSAPWWTDPDGEPLSVGERIDTDMWVILGNTAYASRDEAWLVVSRDDAPSVLHWATGMLSGAIPPLAGIDPESEPVITRRDLADGAEAWRVEIADADGVGIVEWRIGPEGRLSAFLVEGKGVTFEPTLNLGNASTRTVIEFTPTDAPDPIPTPDPDAVPDPSLFGLPADFPLGDDEAAVIDYRAYVEDSLAVLEAYHWNSEIVDWAAARAAALDGLPDDPPADQAHARIQAAIGTFDPFNTVFVRPQDVPPGGMPGGGGGPVQLPSADRIGAVGHVQLPALGDGGMDDFRDYLRAARDAMAAVEAAEPACGWVVDLRDYDAGAWGPSMLALGGLLGEGRAVTFSSPAVEWALEVAADGVITSSGFDESEIPARSPYIDTSFEADADDEHAAIAQEEPPYLPSAGDTPVAVLVGNGTGGGGEQTLVAFLGRPEARIFGGPTGGRPIVAPNLPMADGARLRVPIWVPVDRENRRYTANITPDEVIGDTRPLGSDAVLDAAVDWLDGQPGCP